MRPNLNPAVVAAMARPRTHAVPVEVRLRERVRTFDEAARRTAADGDREAIRDLGVAARRLIAFLRMWRALLPRAGFRRIVRDVRATRRDAGRVRDVEVQVEMLRERLEPHEAPDSEALDLLREMEARLVLRRRRSSKRARSPRSRRLLARLDDAVKAVSQDLISHLEAFEAAHARAQKRREATLGALRTSLESTDVAALQRARIAVEKWRYALESLGDGGERAAATLSALRSLQDVLGGILDGAALRAVVAKGIGEPGPRVPTLLAILTELDAERLRQLERLHALGRDFLRSIEALT